MSLIVQPGIRFFILYENNFAMLNGTNSAFVIWSYIHGPEKVAAATSRNFPHISIILKFRAFLHLFPRFLLKWKQNFEIEIRSLKTCLLYPLTQCMHIYFRRPQRWSACFRTITKVSRTYVEPQKATPLSGFCFNTLICKI